MSTRSGLNVPNSAPKSIISVTPRSCDTPAVLLGATDGTNVEVKCVPVVHADPLAAIRAAALSDCRLTPPHDILDDLPSATSPSYPRVLCHSDGADSDAYWDDDDGAAGCGDRPRMAFNYVGHLGLGMETTAAPSAPPRPRAAVTDGPVAASVVAAICATAAPNPPTVAALKAVVKEEKMEVEREEGDPVEFRLPEVPSFMDMSTVESLTNYHGVVATMLGSRVAQDLGVSTPQDFSRRINSLVSGARLAVDYFFGSYEIVGQLCDEDTDYRPPHMRGVPNVLAEPHKFKVVCHHYGSSRDMVVSATLFNVMAQSYRNVGRISLTSLLPRIKTLYGVNTGDVCTMERNHMTCVYDTIEYYAAWHNRVVAVNFHQGAASLGRTPCALDTVIESETPDLEFWARLKQMLL